MPAESVAEARAMPKLIIARNGVGSMMLNWDGDALLRKMGVADAI